MTLRSTAIIVALVALALAGTATAATQKVLARDSASGSMAYVVYQTKMAFDDDFNLVPQPYGVFKFKVTAPAGQKVEVTWSLESSRGNFSKDLAGKTTTRRGSWSKIVRPAIAQADFVTLNVTATRGFSDSGRMIVTVSGLR